ncbi:MAG: ABC transporter ATP-binding protein [bacterium]
MEKQALVQLRGIKKWYNLGDGKLEILKGIDLEIDEGEFVAIMGPSGSGKSTLMHIIGFLDRPSEGTYKLDGEDVTSFSDDQLAEIRNRKIGFVFQSFNLLARTSALDNVALPMVYAGVPQEERVARAIAALESVGLGHRLDHNPSELSGGQQQRVAIARALVNKPQVIFADEPTGNLDSKSSIDVMRIFQDLNEKEGHTIVFVTHEPDVAEHAKRIVKILDGNLLSDELVKKRRLAVDEEHMYEQKG